MPVTDTRPPETSLGDAFIKDDEAPLMMAITQSDSFGSGNIPQGDLDGPELSLSLSGSSDNMGFDMKNSFEESDLHKDDIHQNQSSSASVASTGTKETVCTTTTQETHPQRPPYSSYPGNYGPPPPSYGRSPYHPAPHYQHGYYGASGHYPCPPPAPYGGPQGAPHPNYNPYYRAPYPPHSGYPPHPSYMHGHVPPHMNSGPNQNPNTSMPPNVESSSSSVASGGSRKRTIDDVREDSQNEFTIHRGNSNGSVCSSGTAGTSANNPVSESLNNLICESPIKKERANPPIQALERSESIESSDSSLTFGGLSMASRPRENKNRPFHPAALPPRQRNDHPYQRDDMFNHSPPSQAGNGATPISKNTRFSKHNAPSFPFDNNAEKTQCGDIFSNVASTTPNNGCNKFPALNQFNDRNTNESGESSSETSPSLSLDIKNQLSWNIVTDNLGETPVSFGSNISPTFWNGDGKSPTGQIFPGITSPSSLDGDILGDGNPSPIPVFFNGPSDSEEKNRHDSQQQIHNERPHQFHDRENVPPPTTSSSMPPSSPYYQRPTTPHSSMRHYDRRDDMLHKNMHPLRREGPPPPPEYQSPRPLYHHHQHPNDRIVNLRGRAPAPGALQSPHQVPTLHLPPHLPTHPHFLTSPIGVPNPRNMMVMSSPHHQHMNSPYSHGTPQTSSKRRCAPLKHPIPSKFQGDMDQFKNAQIPDFTSLVNFPAHMSQKQGVNLPEGMRCCVMCGQACNCSSSKNKKGGKKNEDVGRKNGQFPIIPTQNKGLCTQCDVNVWVVVQSNLEIKWCKGCKNFRPWAAFGDKGLATKCVRCRDRQREKYAAQKFEKDKKKQSKVAQRK